MSGASTESFRGKHLLLVGTGGVKRQRVLAALRALGLGRITCLNDRPNWAARYVDDWIEADPVGPSEATIDRAISRLGRVDGVLTYDDYSTILAAHLAKAFKVVGITPEAAERAKDKSVFRQVCADHGLPTPRFWRVDPAPAGPRSLGHALAERGIQFPVVVKPTRGGGSVLVRRADNIAELVATLEAHARAVATESAAALWPDRSVVIEEYLPGQEVDIDMLVQGGDVRYAAVTDNFPPPPEHGPYFMEFAGQIPSALPEAAQTELVCLATEVLRALGVDDSCVHFEARWTRDGAVPIEANLRIGGAEVYEFNRGAYGVDLVEGALAIALGVPVPPFRGVAPLRYLRSMAFIPSRSGRIAAISVDPHVEQHDAFRELVLFRGVGEPVRIPPEGFDYIGWMVAAGGSRAEADARIAELGQGVRIELSPLAEES